MYTNTSKYINIYIGNISIIIINDISNNINSVNNNFYKINF